MTLPDPQRVALSRRGFLKVSGATGAIVAAAACGGPSVASGVENDDRLRRPAVRRTLQLGSTRVTFLPDGAVELRPRALLPDTTETVWADHPEYLDDQGNLVASIGGLLVEQGDRALLIDAGFGPLSMPPDPDPAAPRGAIHGGALMDSLTETGRAPEDVEAVAFTHLHPDHIGWACHPAPGRADPPFIRANYLVSESEWAQWQSTGDQDTANDRAVMSPRVRTVADGSEIFPGVRMRLAPGHTAGHAEYVIEGDGQRLIAFGDALHSPIQIDHPEWSSSFDYDPAQSAEHRRRLVAELAQPATIGFGGHFADVVFGQVQLLDGDGPGWHPLDASTEPRPGSGS